MERAVALKKLRKILGDKLGYRVDPKAPDAEVRAMARTRSVELSAKLRVVDAAREARRAVILAADETYRNLAAEAVLLRDARDKASSTSHHFRVTVGLVSELFFSVKAQGDSWEDVIKQLETKR